MLASRRLLTTRSHTSYRVVFITYQRLSERKTRSWQRSSLTVSSLLHLSLSMKTWLKVRLWRSTTLAKSKRPWLDKWKRRYHCQTKSWPQLKQVQEYSSSIRNHRCSPTMFFQLKRMPSRHRNPRKVPRPCDLRKKSSTKILAQVNHTMLINTSDPRASQLSNSRGIQAKTKSTSSSGKSSIDKRKNSRSSKSSWGISWAYGDPCSKRLVIGRLMLWGDKF